ncbi:porin [Parvularcula dongshanensis]|uniref:Porin domain-containing protein n=1 Tax=Parvularcula dongshanensis TaxID=1173995 RepID=A0A840I1B3_9PROT|nr:hypothetical protein [Parvularcula dongshanensis]
MRHAAPVTSRSALLRLAAGTLALFAGLGVQAQDSRIEVTGEVSAAPGVVDGDVKADADALIRAEGTTVTGSGLELGAGAALRADSDMPEHRYAGGRYSSLTAGGPRGLGLSSGDVFVEGAYLFARGGFGSLYVGRDDGVASRLAVTSPSIFRAVRVGDWRSDLTGLNDVHVLNDFSGSATKLTYMPPPGLLGGIIGQVQMGVSYAPRLGDCGSDACAPVNGYVPLETGEGSVLVSPEQSWRDVVEAAIYYQKGIEVSGEPLQLGLGASYVSAQEDEALVFPGLDLLGDYRAYAFGMNVAYGGLTVGGSVKSTNAGLRDTDDEDYLAFDAGVTYEAGDWNFMLGYGAADAGRDAGLLVGPVQNPIPYALDRRTQTAQAGVSKVLGQGVSLGVAAQYVDADKPDALGGPENAAAIVLESSIKF